MSDHKDPQRISDSADNCEVLRARLAKYEDAEGRPVLVLPEQTKDALEWVDDFIARCNGDDRGSDDSVNALRAALESQAREIERLSREAKNDAIAYKAAIERQDELRADIEQLKERGDVNAERANRLAESLAALKTQPSGVDERAAFPVEAYLWPLEIGVEAQQRAADAGCERIDCLHDGIQAMLEQFKKSHTKAFEPLPYWEPCNPGCDPELNGQRSKHCANYCELARTALSAPSHGEQVREVVPDEWQTMLARVTDELDALNCAMRDQIDDDMAEPEEEAELCKATDELIDEARALIAAAPSAGSQEQG